MLVQSMCQEDLLEEEMTIHSSFPAWRMPWTEASGELQSIGLESQTRLKRLSMHAQLIYNIVLISDVRQSDLVIFFFR